MKNPKERFMKAAIKEAIKAEMLDEVPIGCVVVKDNKIIARGYNVRETKQESTGHAEIKTLQKACKKLNSWRLEDCDLYVTVEPCIMCGGAIIQSRIRNVYFGAYDPKGGAFGSSINILGAKNINHHPNVEGGILEKECAELIKEFFKRKRNK